MRKKIALGLLAFILVSLFGLGIANAREAARRSRPIDDPVLTAGQKAQIAGALRLQRELGDQVWPGFAKTEVPIILFNDKYEFLVGAQTLPAPWTVVQGDDFTGSTYYSRVAKDPQSFAVPLGRGWAASLGSVDLMNRELFLNLRRDFPPVVAQLFPYPWATVGEDFGQAGLLHEMFHVHQAITNLQRFQEAERLYNQNRSRYPYADEAFTAAWNREGQLLAAALKATDEAECRRLVTEFLSVRKNRRTAAALSPELVVMEQEREWLEGVALYVEMTAYDKAATAEWEGFRTGLPYWQTYLRILEKSLGAEGGDSRFYPSGMAMARLLDRLSPGWKARVLEQGVTLEQLLSVS